MADLGLRVWSSGEVGLSRVWQRQCVLMFGIGGVPSGIMMYRFGNALCGLVGLGMVS